MTRRKTIFYWVATAWLALGMTSTGVVQLIQMKPEAEMMGRLGYPLYFMTLLGICKLLGVVTILLPKLPWLKEWAYAGFFFTTSGAVISYLAVGDAILQLFGPVLLLLLTMVSWYFRPDDRKLPSAQPNSSVQ